MTRAVRLVLFAFVATHPACFTSKLWSGELDLDEPQKPKLVERHPDRPIDSSFEAVAIRVVATPVTLALDLLTSPLQVLWLCLVDEDEHEHEHEHDPRP